MGFKHMTTGIHVPVQWSEFFQTSISQLFNLCIITVSDDQWCLSPQFCINCVIFHTFTWSSFKHGLHRSYSWNFTNVKHSLQTLEHFLEILFFQPIPRKLVESKESFYHNLILLSQVFTLHILEALHFRPCKSCLTVLYYVVFQRRWNCYHYNYSLIANE